MLFTIIPAITTICFLASLLLLKGEKGWWKLFIGFLGLTALVEITGYVLFFQLGQKNHWVFNLYLPLEISFFFFILNRTCDSLFNVKKLIAIAWGIFIILYLVESIQSSFAEYSMYSNLYAAVLIIIITLFFYYQLMKQETYIELGSYAVFWIISGLFIFYLGTVACNIFQVQLTNLYNRLGLPIRYIIMLVLNFILYATWSYAFLCKFRQRTLSPSLSSLH